MDGGPRGKASGKIEKLKEELRSNDRLSIVFSICKELKIDDPIHWMNSVRPIVIDWWIAYLSHESDLEKEAYKKASKKTTGREMQPSEAAAFLSNKAK